MHTVVYQQKETHGIFKYHSDSDDPILFRCMPINTLHIWKLKCKSSFSFEAILIYNG